MRSRTQRSRIHIPKDFYIGCVMLLGVILMIAYVPPTNIIFVVTVIGLLMAVMFLTLRRFLVVPVAALAVGAAGAGWLLHSLRMLDPINGLLLGAVVVGIALLMHQK